MYSNSIRTETPRGSLLPPTKIIGAEWGTAACSLLSIISTAAGPPGPCCVVVAPQVPHRPHSSPLWQSHNKLLEKAESSTALFRSSLVQLYLFPGRGIEGILARDVLGCTSRAASMYNAGVDSIYRIASVPAAARHKEV